MLKLVVKLLATQAAKEYAEFLAKFEAKKTTDDCFTPPEVFAAVHEWAATEYELQDRRIVRPFHPGGDFVAFDYQPGEQWRDAAMRYLGLLP